MKKIVFIYLIVLAAVVLAVSFYLISKLSQADNVSLSVAPNVPEIISENKAGDDFAETNDLAEKEDLTKKAGIAADEITAVTDKKINSENLAANGSITEATEFCNNLENNQDRGLLFVPVAMAAPGPNEGVLVGPATYIKFDNDDDKEILGTCKTDLNGGFAVLFVLDKVGNDYKPVILLDKRAEIGQRHIIFKDVKAEDMNGDGLDEIIYIDSMWSMRAGENGRYVYSPTLKQWFWRKVSWSVDIDVQKTEEISYSSNFNLDFNGKIKKYLDGFEKK